MNTASESTDEPRALATTRRQFLSLLGVATTMAAVPPTAFAAAGKREEQRGGRPDRAVARYAYVGTYTAPFTAPGGTATSTALGIYV